VYLRQLAKEDQSQWTSKQMGGVYQTFRDLTHETLAYLNGLPEELHIILPTEASRPVSVYAQHISQVFDANSSKTNCGSASYGKRMLAEPFSHAQFLAEFNEQVNREGPVRTAMERINADIIAFGHNHLQCHARMGDKLILNPGSCGQPLDFRVGAPYTIVEVSRDANDMISYHLDERRVPYDIEAVIAHTKQSAIYKAGMMWAELTHLALREARDYFSAFWEIARNIAASKGEQTQHNPGGFFSNDTWDEASRIFTAQQTSCMTENFCEAREWQ